MAQGKNINALALALALLLVLAPLPPRTVIVARASVSCATVYSTLMPCLQYVQSGGAVSPTCCSGIRTILAFARTTSDRRSTCTCLKDVSSGAAGGPYLSRAAGLPSRCHVQAPFKIDPNVDCNAIH